MLRSAGIVAVIVLLAVTAASANAVIVADRTVLDPGFVREGLEAERAYQGMTDAATELVAAGEDGGAPAAAFGVDGEQVVADALPPAYLEAQTEANVNRTYAYLYGDRRDLVFSLDPDPVRERAAASVTAQINDTPPAVILREFVANETLTIEGVDIELVVLADMAENETAYAEARGEVRDEVRSGVLDRFVEEAFGSASDDELLALVIEDYDPRDYSEDEKAAMVADREAEIRDALRAEIEAERGDEVDAAVDEQLDTLREIARTRVEEVAASGASGVEAAVVGAATDMVLVSVDGLTTDLAYDEYRERLEDSRAAFAEKAGAAAGELVAAQLPAEVDATGELSSSERRSLETLRSAVQAVDFLVVGLPVLALLLIGGLWWLTRSPAVTAGGSGGALAIGGLPGLVIAARLPAMANAAFKGPDPTGLAGVLVGLMSRSAGVLWTQSLVLVGVGVALALVGVVFYLDDRGIITLPSR